LTPAWNPDPETVESSNLTELMKEVGAADYAALHRWSVERRSDFWERAIGALGLTFTKPYDHVLAGDAEHPRWLEGAELNIVSSCFSSPPDWAAIVYAEGGSVNIITYDELRTAVDRVANGFVAAGFSPGVRVAIAMPMNPASVAAYLGIIAAGGVVVSIADSFAPDEIATRLRLTKAEIVLTQDRIERAGKDLSMYDKVIEAGASRAIVVDTGSGGELRDDDMRWDEFLGSTDHFEPVVGPPSAHTNILFSSGTTGEPKVIPWTQLTPIKAAMDGHFHHDIHPDDVVSWPTNLGWMMGPWLIYASLINGAALALYDDVPTSRGFAEFVQDAGVTVLGLVPSLVAAWRGSGTLDGLDWSGIRLFSSTGEASNADDMAWLMSVAGGRPVIEYCGGTEIGGGYLAGTVLQPAVPAAFSTPALGIDIRILDERGEDAPSGELFLVPPSIGLSTELLGRDHHEVYFAGAPVPGLRRHGDHIEALGDGYYRAHGRIDDTMNLGGIKVSSAEIERAVLGVGGVSETAAVAAPPPGGGPSRLVIFAVLEKGTESDTDRLREGMQQAIREHLNPLFKVHDVVVVEKLPRTASAKVMRRELRAQYAD
jgi:acetyl-CoA synthetase